MHLGDLGTEVYLQELNATLLENESYLRGEVVAAMERIENGTYGTCENCGKTIIEERLELIPYARYCTPCAEKLQAGKDINLNEGRPRGPDETFSPYDPRVAPEFKGTDYTSREVKGRRPDRDDSALRKGGDIHAAGTAGGGTAEGGLAGTNVGEGDPDNADLEDAMGSGNHDVAIEKDDEDTVPYSGPHGRRGRRHTGGQAGRRGQDPPPRHRAQRRSGPARILNHEAESGRTGSVTTNNTNSHEWGTGRPPGRPD